MRFLAAALLYLVLFTTALVLPWRWITPPTTSFILREQAARDEPIYYQWTPWEEISPNLAIAALAAEDQKFYQHHGFDWVAIQAALDRNRQSGRVRGGSTISQQVAKNLFLWPGQSWIRKGIEAHLTIWIELLWPKQRILEVYLNVAQFGPGLFGVGAASGCLLGKSSVELSPHDGAVLVAVLPNPRRMSAANPSEYVRTRAREILAVVEQLGGSAYLGGS